MKKVKKQMLNVVLFTLLFVIIACVTIGTYAWFTDQKSFSTNELKFGTITLNVTGDSISGENLNVVVTRSEQVVETIKLMPGDTIGLKFNITLNSDCESVYYLAYLMGSDILTAGNVNGTGFYGSSSGTSRSLAEENKIGNLDAGKTHKFDMSVTISTDYETQGESVEVSLAVYAIQKANLTVKEAYKKITNMYLEDYEKMYVENSPATYTRVGDYIYFGSFPQTYAGTSASELGIIDETTVDSNGYYTSIDGTKYAKITVAADRTYANYNSDILPNIKALMGDSWKQLVQYSNGKYIINGVSAYFKVEKVRWRILKESDGKALIVSDEILGNYKFGATANYANSYLRQLLTNIYKLFTANEKQFIQQTTVDNSASTTYNYTTDVANTQDYLFALSYSELTNDGYGYVGDIANKEEREFCVTDYAIAMGAEFNVYKEGSFWTRSAELNSDGTESVSYWGSGSEDLVYVDGQNTTYGCGVLPAMWIVL